MRIPLRLDEELGVDRDGETCRFGVPLEPGRLRDPATVRLLDAAGDDLVCVATSIERWPDGSVRWLRLEALLTVAGSSSAHLVLTDDGPGGRDPATPVAADWDGPALRLQRDDVEIVLTPGAPLGAPAAGTAALPRFEVVDHAGAVHQLRRLDRVELVHATPLRVIARGYGRHVDADGRTWLDAELEVCLVAGQAAVTVSHRVVNREAGAAQLAGWRAHTLVGATTRGACGQHDAVHATSTPFALHAEGTGYTRGIFATSRVEGGSDWQDHSDPTHWDEWQWSELEGRHGANWIWAGQADAVGDLVVVDEMLVHHPAALRWTPSDVEVQFWAPLDGETLRLEQGMAKRRSLAIVRGVPIGAASRLAASRAVPLVARREPAVSEAIGVPLPRPDAPLAPDAERAARRDLFSWYLYGQSTGLLDHGDCVTEDPFGVRRGFSANNEHDALFALGLLWLRSGERAALASASAYADHLVDVDQIHHSTRNDFEVGGLRAHGPGHLKYTPARTVDGPVDTSIDTGHMWVEGLLLHTAVTGDERYRSAAIEVGECLARLVRLGWCRPQPGPRNSGWPLIAFAALYRSTGDDRWLQEARTVADAALVGQDPDGRWTMRTGFRRSFCAWQHAILLVGLDRLLEADPAPSTAVAAAHQRGCRALLDLGRHEDGSFVFMDHYEYRTVAWYGLVREALAGAWRRTGDRSFLTAGLAGGPDWHANGPATNNDLAEWRGHLPFYAALVEAGLVPTGGEGAAT